MEICCRISYRILRQGSLVSPSFAGALQARLHAQTTNTFCCCSVTSKSLPVLIISQDVCIDVQAALKKAAPKKKLSVPRPAEELKMVCS